MTAGVVVSNTAFWDIARDMVFIAAAIGGALTYAWALRRQAAAMAATKTIEVYQAEMEAMRVRSERLEGELHSARSEISRLSGQLEAAERDRRELRSLVMGEKVPQALADALGHLGGQIVAALGEAERRITEKVVAR